jgi:hypothetical protein
MAESNRSYSAIPVGIALAAAVVLGSCGGGGDEDQGGVAVYIKASNTETNDSFGGALALSSDGNTLAVGARGEASNANGINGDQTNNTTPGAGAVYVLIRSGMAWGQQVYVKPLSVGITGAGDNFGASIALSADGNTLAVGAPLEDSATTGIDSTPDEAASGAGAVYVYTRSPAGVWSQQAYVKASNIGTTSAGDNFGISVALSADGNTLAVGAHLEDSSTNGINTTPNEIAADAGAAYVFSRSGTVWSQQAYIKASNSLAGDNFGVSVALSGDGNTLAVGAPLEDTTAVDAGAVYVFTRSGTTWAEQAPIKASNPGPGDNFGVSVALSSSDGNTLAVGARNEASSATGINGDQTNNGAPGAGAVYVLVRTGTAWAQQAYIKASNTIPTGTPGDNFGGSVALSGDGNTLMVGAVNEDGSATGIGGTSNELASDAGAVYVYSRTGTTWTHQSYVKASNTGAGDGFGIAVALSSTGSTRAVGAQFEDGNATGINGNQSNNNAANAGAVYVYQ